MKKLKPVKPVTKIKKIKKVQKIKKIKKKKIPITADMVGTSKIEKEFYYSLLSSDIFVKEQHQIGYKFYDFVLIGHRIVIEFDGDYWHCNPEVYPNGPINKMQEKAIANDRHKKILAESLGYKLIRVWEKDYKNDPKKVIASIKRKINNFIDKKKEILL